jgi:phytoene/squalene synthetase
VSMPGGLKGFGPEPQKNSRPVTNSLKQTTERKSVDESSVDAVFRS